MKKRIIIEILFICLIGVLGWYLHGIMKQEESRNTRLKHNRNNTTFMSGSGIDVIGNSVDSIKVKETTSLGRNKVAFLLRYSSLDADLQFWNEVRGLLLNNDDVQLVAYCENTHCVDVIKNKPDMADFTVLEYGEIVDIQAVLNVDANGEFWLLGKNTKKIKWRDESKTPFDIALSIGLGL